MHLLYEISAQCKKKEFRIIFVTTAVPYELVCECPIVYLYYVSVSLQSFYFHTVNRCSVLNARLTLRWTIILGSTVVFFELSVPDWFLIPTYILKFSTVRVLLWMLERKLFLEYCKTKWRKWRNVRNNEEFPSVLIILTINPIVYFILYVCMCMMKKYLNKLWHPIKSLHIGTWDHIPIITEAV